jgi:hypothetical protein
VRRRTVTSTSTASASARNNYFFARAAVGAEFYFPVTCTVPAGHG